MAIVTYTQEHPEYGTAAPLLTRFKSVTKSWAVADVAAFDIVAAPGAGKKIVVHALWHTSDTVQANIIQSNDGAPAAIFAIRQATAVADVVLSFNPVGWFACEDNGALQLDPNNGTAGNGTILVVYSIQDSD